jgi:hypothetical protein
MVLDGDAAYFSEALVDLQVAAVGRKAGEADRRRIVDQLQGGLLRKQHDRRRLHRSRTAIRVPGQRMLPAGWCWSPCAVAVPPRARALKFCNSRAHPENDTGTARVSGALILKDYQSGRGRLCENGRVTIPGIPPLRWPNGSILSLTFGWVSCYEAGCCWFCRIRPVVALRWVACRFDGSSGSGILKLVLKLPGVVNDRTWDLTGELAGLCSSHRRRRT